MIDLAHAAGKYGAYIWPAYGVSLAALMGMIVDTAMRSRHWRREVDQRRKGLAADEPDEG